MARPFRARRRRFTVEERARFVELLQQSGMTKRAFARQHGFHEVTLYNWLRRSRKDNLRPAPAFKEVGLPVLTSGWATEIALGQDIQIRLAATPPAEFIAQVVRQLRPSC